MTGLTLEDREFIERFESAFTCHFCKSKEKICDHHVLPKWVMGPDSEENLVPVCMSCHKKLENLTKEIMRDGIERIKKEFRSYMKKQKAYRYPELPAVGIAPRVPPRDPYYYYKSLGKKQEVFLSMVRFIVHEFLPKWNQHKTKTIEEAAYTSLSGARKHPGEAPLHSSETAQTEKGSNVRRKEPTKCKWCGEKFPKRGGINVKKCRMEHLRLFHRMEGITLANYEEHFEPLSQSNLDSHGSADARILHLEKGASTPIRRARGKS